MFILSGSLSLPSGTINSSTGSQPLLELTNLGKSIIACSHHLHISAILNAFRVRGASRIQRRAAEWLQQQQTNVEILKYNFWRIHFFGDKD